MVVRNAQRPDAKLGRLTQPPRIMSARRDSHDPTAHHRTEPTLGDLDQLDAPRKPGDDGLPHVTVEPRREHRPADGAGRSRRRNRRWMVVVLLLLVAAAALWFNQNRLRNMLPRTDLNNVLSQAQAALQQGHLDGQDGTSARELFQQAVALEPDNDRARDGLHQVGEAELSQADAALQAGHVAQAAQQAAVARELLGGGSDVDRLDTLISRAQASQVQTADLVDQAQQALAAGKLDGPQGAGALYQRMLQADPGNAIAAHGLDQVGNALAARARSAFDANDPVAAGASIDALAALQPNNGALPALRATQAQLRQQHDVARDNAIKQGQDALRAGRVAGAGDDTALAYFKAALALDPDNAQARDGLGDVAQALTVQANASIDAGDIAQARQLLAQAAQLAPKSADIAAARARLAGHAAAAAKDKAAVADASLPLTQPVLTPQQSATIAQLVQRAQQAARNGNIMMPPGDCAYDLYRSALAINGNDAQALQGLQGLSAQVEKLFDQALAAGDLVQAGDRLATLGQLSPGDPGQAALGARLASAWLDKAGQQLANGDRIGAGQSLEQARKLAPNHPRVLDMAARLQAGQ